MGAVNGTNSPRCFPLVRWRALGKPRGIQDGAGADGRLATGRAAACIKMAAVAGVRGLFKWLATVDSAKGGQGEGR